MELSPRSKPIKYTYLDRQKKKSKEYSDLFSGSESDMPVDTMSNASTTVNKVKKTAAKPTSSAAKPASTTGKSVSSAPIKKIDFKVPSPKRPEDSKPLSRSHARTLSMGSLHGIAPPSSTGKAPNRFPPKARSSLQKESESEMDDDASVAESFVSVSRVRRTEPERIAYFKNQPECSELETHRVLCTRCRKYVSLGKKQTYAVRPWEKHREKCDQKLPVNGDGNSEGTTVVQTKTLAERKSALENDFRAEKVEADQVLCKRCQKWIKSASNNDYSLTTWNKHQLHCSDTKPSSRTLMAERKIRVINDAQVKSHSPRHIDCKQCGATVELDGAEYNLGNWDAHKADCVPHAAASVSGSTDVTLVSPSKGKKRVLDEVEPDEEDELPVTNKARDDAYEAPTQEAPSALGWFLRPIREFVRGFAEGLS